MSATSEMDNEQLGKLIRNTATAIDEDQPGFWKFEFGGSMVLVITDESHNRMRIMTPVFDIDAISTDTFRVLLSANFDRALDARYCIKDNVLWSAFLHPLRELDDDQFLDALNQVVTLSKNYGTTYTSSDLVFGG